MTARRRRNPAKLLGTKIHPSDLLATAAIWLLSIVLYRQTVLTNLILPGVDAFTYFYPYRAYAAASIREGHIPLWNPYLFMGVPFLANPQAAVFYPLNLALCFLPAPRLLIWSVVIHIAMAATFAYLYARHVLGLGPTAALLGGGAFAWGGFLCGQTEHVNQVNVYAWFPLLLLLWEWRRRARLPALIGLGMVIGVGLLAGHAQASYITLFGLVIYALTTATRTERPPHRGITARLWDAIWSLGIAILVGLGVAAVQLLPTLELTRFSVRSGGLSYREAVSFSLKPSPHLLRYTFLPPWGSNLAAAFGGDFFTEYLAYVGIVPLAMALLAQPGINKLLRLRQSPPAARSVIAMLALAVCGLFLALGLYNPLYLVLYKLLPGLSLFRAPVRWLFLYAFGVAMLAAIGLQRLSGLLRGHRVTRLLPFSLTCISFLELLAAARHLPLHHPTAPEAFSSLRTAPAHILAAQRHQVTPGRFLSMSDIRFDPGDLGEIELMFKNQLPERSIYDYIVCAKRKEIIAPNLALAWRIYGVDGYDGGVLPLARYVYLQRLLLDEQDILTDGRLREGLKRIPPARLLSLFGVRYLITDKVNDVWIDDVFYDLAFDSVLSAAADRPEATVTTELPSFVATSLGLVSYLEGGERVPDGTPVAEVCVTTTNGKYTFTLRAGRDTAEGAYKEGTAHQMARVGHRHESVNEYITRLRWRQATRVTRLKVVALPFGGQFHLRGAALIDERDGSNVPLVLSTQGRYRQVHSGDVKIYQVNDALPRAYLVHTTHIIADDQATLAALANPDFNPAQEVVLASGRQLTGTSHLTEAVQPILYSPEKVALRVNATSPGYLVLSDTWYPGWKATVDGQPTRVERANLNFRAVYVDSGTHIVRFTYRPSSYSVGLAISGTTLLTTILLLLKNRPGRG